MDTLRRRVPFKFQENDVDGRILDEQEQEELIDNIRKENATSNAQYRLLLKVILGLSMFLQITYLITPSKHSPLIALFPLASPSNSALSPIPLSTILTLLSIALHLNLILLSQPAWLYDFKNYIPSPIPFDMAYALSAVAPSLSFFMQKPWQTTLWWCATPTMVFIAQTVMDAIDLGNHSVVEVEAMKYNSPGA